jgi:hypoxanthine phosphoribosyltransferase
MSKDYFECELMSWDYFYELSKIVAQKMKKSEYVPDIIIGVARGGWVFARILCDFQGIKDLLSLKVEHWGITAAPDGEAKLKFPLTVDLSNKRCLVVDDITDTGESMIKAVEHIQKLNPLDVHTAALMHIKDSKFIPDYFAKEINWRWVIFPWNFFEDLCNIIPKALKYKNKDFDAEYTKKMLKKNFKIDLKKSAIEEVFNEYQRRKSLKK